MKPGSSKSLQFVCVVILYAKTIYNNKKKNDPHDCWVYNSLFLLIITLNMFKDFKGPQSEQWKDLVWSCDLVRSTFSFPLHLQFALQYKCES